MSFSWLSTSIGCGPFFDMAGGKESAGGFPTNAKSGRFGVEWPHVWSSTSWINCGPSLSSGAHCSWSPTLILKCSRQIHHEILTRTSPRGWSRVLKVVPMAQLHTWVFLVEDLVESLQNTLVKLKAKEILLFLGNFTRQRYIHSIHQCGVLKTFIAHLEKWVHCPCDHVALSDPTRVCIPIPVCLGPKATSSDTTSWI